MMKNLFRYILLLFVIMVAMPQDIDAQVKNRWGVFRGASNSNNRNIRYRYMVKHTGLVFAAGIDVQQSDKHKGYNFVHNVGWRFESGFTAGAGIMPGVAITTFNKEITGAYWRGRKVDNEYVEGVTEDPHAVEFNWTYFAMPIYVYANYEFFQATVSPSVQARLGGKIKAAGFGGSPYAHAHLGCRVALARASVTPYIGFTFNDSDEDFQKTCIAFGVMVGF